MKQKILTALKNKYANLGFGQKALDGVADYLEKTVTEESQIETAIVGVESLLKVFQAEADRSRTELNALRVENEELKKKQQTPPKEGEQQGEPEWFKAFKKEQEERYNALKQESDTLKSEKARAERASLIAEKAKEFGIPEKIASRLSVADDANLDDYFKGVKQELSDAGFEFSERPDVGGGVKTNGESIANLINEGTKQIVEQSKK